MTCGMSVVMDIWNPFPGNERPIFTVVGSCKQLGWWNPKKALIGEQLDEDRRMWRASVLVPRWFNTIEFQWVALDPVTKEVVRWEQCPVRVIPLRQNTEHVSCWFESKASIIKILPVNRLGNAEWKKRNLQRCIEDIRIYRVHDLIVDIKFEYYTPNGTEANHTSFEEIESANDTVQEILDLNDMNVRINQELDYNCNEVSGFLNRVPCQISRVDGEMIADMMSPGGAADQRDIRQEEGQEHVPMWRRVFSLKGVLATGLLIGAAVAAGRYVKSL